MNTDIDPIFANHKESLPWLRDRTIFLTVHGSQAYGTSLPTSDTDYKGIVIPPPEYFLGFVNHFEQAECHAPDAVLYDIRKFFALASDCNPNIIEVLFTDDKYHVLEDPIFRFLKDNRKLVLSLKAKHTFSGYALAQMKRIMVHYKWLRDPPKAPPRREDFGLRPENEMTGAQRDNLGSAMALVDKEVATWHDLNWTDLEESQRIALRNRMTDYLARMSVSKEDQYIHAAKSLGMDDNLTLLLVKEKAYRSKRQDWDSYQTWLKTRNPARAEIEAKFGYDCYLDDTEFLTGTGWKRYDEISDDTELGTLNQMTGRIEFQHFTERVAKPYDGPIAFMHPRHSQCAVTLNHRMWVSRSHRCSANGFSTGYTPESAQWGIQRMEDLLDNYHSRFHVRVTGTPKIEDYNIGDDLLTLLGCYVSEGCVGHRTGDGVASVLRVSQKVGGRQALYMDALQGKYPGMIRDFLVVHDEEWRKEPCEERVWTVANRTWAEQSETWCGSGSRFKHLPTWVTELSVRQVNLLLDVMVAGDGTNRPCSRVYYTSSKQLADDVQTMCVVAGIVSQVWGPYQYDEDETPMYQVYIGPALEVVSVGFRREGSQHITVENVKNARIVCFTVPNEVLVTRRNGNVAIQGNTKHAMHLVRLLRMCREILTQGEVFVYRPDFEELLAIRNGAYTYDQLVEWTHTQDKELDEIYKTTKALPKSPDRRELDRLCCQMVREFNGVDPSMPYFELAPQCPEHPTEGVIKGRSPCEVSEVWICQRCRTAIGKVK